MPENLTITDLHVAVEGKPILRGVNLTLVQGETHALMGPNGSGKSTLGNAIMGHPAYEITHGEIELGGDSILPWDACARARAGLFMAFQRPLAIPGVKMADFLRHSVTNIRNPERKDGEELIPMRQFRKELTEKMDHLQIDVEFARRYVNDGFSGGEMKRAEILQLAMLRPKFAILDETDSGLDVDAVKLASESIAQIGKRQLAASNQSNQETTPEKEASNVSTAPSMGILIITHHDKLLDRNPPDFTHVMLGGRIVETGGLDLAQELYSEGYDRIRANYVASAALEDSMVDQAAI